MVGWYKRVQLDTQTGETAYNNLLAALLVVVVVNLFFFSAKSVGG